MAKNYFDKFIEDQLRREAKNNKRREKLDQQDDPKRELLRRYREHVLHLKVWKKK